MRTLLLALFLLALAPGCDRIAAHADPLLAEVQPAIDTVGAIDKTDEEYRKADAVLAKALVDGRFRYLDQEDQGEIVAGAGWGAFRLDDDERARTQFFRATQLAPAELQNWRLLAIVENRLDHHQAAVRAMLVWLKGQERLEAKQENAVIALALDAEPGDKDDLALLQWLFDHDWQSSDSRTGDVWLRLALEQLRRGQADKAKLAVARITTPGALVKLRSDLRFVGLYDAASPAFDPREAAFRHAARVEAAATREPDDVDLRVDLVHALLSVGLDEAALRIADETLATLQDGDEAPDEDELRTAQEARARVLLATGRGAEGLALMQTAATAGKDGQSPVNQTLDLADLYCDLGRGKDTLATAARVAGSKDMNDYGRMVHAYLRHCGARLEGDAAASAEALAFLRTHHEDAESLLLAALLREERFDEAAAALIRRLASETERGDVLYALQDFRSRPPLSPDAPSLARQWTVLMAREDVQAALRKVGAVASYDYYG